MNILAIDVGGTHVKVLVTGQEEARKIPSGPAYTPAQMIQDVKAAVKDWKFDVISIGFPSPTERGKILREPVNLGPGWMHVDFAADFGCPVRMINDAAMQALGSYEGGRMLFLGLGTGLGSAMVVEKVLIPLELAHLPYKKGAEFEDYVGERGLLRLGKKKWIKAVFDVVDRLHKALVADSIVIGGGNIKKLQELPVGARAGDNRNAFLGGFRMWDESYKLP